MAVKIGVANTEQIPAYPNPGDTVTFRCKVYNIGTEPSVPCRIALFEGSKLGELKEIPGTSKYVPSLSPMKSLSETLDYEFKYQAPVETAAYRKVWIILDPERKNQMSYEDWVEKCTKTFQVVVQGSKKTWDPRETQPIIELRIEAPDRVNINQTFTVKVSLWNVGATYAGYLTVNLYGNSTLLKTYRTNTQYFEQGMAYYYEYTMKSSNEGSITFRAEVPELKLSQSKTVYTTGTGGTGTGGTGGISGGGTGSIDSGGTSTNEQLIQYYQKQIEELNKQIQELQKQYDQSQSEQIAVLEKKYLEEIARLQKQIEYLSKKDTTTTTTTSNDNLPDFSSVPLDMTTIIALGGAGLAILLAVMLALL
mgnify:CR=1 FL=1